ncbi:MAG: hypothetical protein KKB51_16210 [Candidatus Riflebacteria bacterium]|nr:hypothetical protein [Candidatus Riflebacteria bacterium]
MINMFLAVLFIALEFKAFVAKFQSSTVLNLLQKRHLTLLEVKWYKEVGSKNMKKITSLLVAFLLAAAGFWLGVLLTRPPGRTVETQRMETCLLLYQDYRTYNDQKKLAAELERISLNPRDFQEIIDRFIYYRTRKSSMNQAMQLLQAFKMGYDIDAASIFSISGMASEPFRLDAEILAVFESKPELIKKAFEG